MAYNARVFRIFIASPSDVQEEREVIARIIREWNDLHSFERKVVLLPLRWETHAAPELGKRPQEIINTEIVDHADMAVGVFWTRIGTPTGEFASGTIEEIERLGSAGKLVMCYFSKAKAELDNLDLEQFKLLKEFKKKTYPNGIVETYSNIVEFRDKFAKQLEIKVRALISKDSSEDGQHIETKPNLDFQFIDPISKNLIGLDYLVSPKIIEFNKKDFEAIPDYKAGKSNITDIIGLSLGDNNNFFKEYFHFIRREWQMIPIQFALKNTSSIAIRDIFIELVCSRNAEFEINTNRPERPEKSRRYSFNLSENLNGVFGKSTLSLVSSDSIYKIQLGYDALQPQRFVTLEHPLFITGNIDADVIFDVNIYADCFANPLNKKLKISIKPTKISKKPVEILKELEVLEK